MRYVLLALRLVLNPSEDLKFISINQRCNCHFPFCKVYRQLNIPPEIAPDLQRFMQNMTDNHNSEGYPTYQEGNQYTSPTMAAISKIMESENKTQNSSSDFTVKEKNIYYKKIKL